MSPNSARTIVLVAAGLMFAAIALRRDKIADPFRYAWAAGVITLGLSLLADIAPEIAGPFAILLLMAIYWRNRSSFSGLLPTRENIGQSAPPGVRGPVGQPSTAPAGPVGPVG